MVFIYKSNLNNTYLLFLAMASNNVIFDQTFSKSGRVEYKTKFGRNKSLTFKKSVRGGFYFLDLECGHTKLNIGLDELDELFTMRGQLESLTGYFEQPHIQESLIVPEPALIVTGREQDKIILENRNNKENKPLMFRPPTPFLPPTSVNMKLQTAASVVKNEVSILNRNYFRPIQQIEQSEGRAIPTWITRQASAMPPPPSKRVRYEDLSPAPTEVYDMSEVELSEFLQDM